MGPSFDQTSWCPVITGGYALWGQKELNLWEELLSHSSLAWNTASSEGRGVGGHMFALLCVATQVGQSRTIQQTDYAQWLEGDPSGTFS